MSSRASPPEPSDAAAPLEALATAVLVVAALAAILVFT